MASKTQVTLRNTALPAENSSLTISVVILTYLRTDSLKELLTHLGAISPMLQEIIVVDNAADSETRSIVESFPQVEYVKNDANMGACGRNSGMEAASGDLVITLDDDVFGLLPSDLDRIRCAFKEDASLAALNFRVVDNFSGQLTNWVHHRHTASAEEQFDTYEITEGAVAFRRSALDVGGMYWPRYFISHEGPDLSFRLMNRGFVVRYDGSIVVKHKHEQSGRPSWRFYYYDTRNLLWLAARNMDFRYAASFLFVQLLAMAYYSISSGYFHWWVKAVADGMLALPSVFKTREAWTRDTADRVRAIDRAKVPFMTRVRQKLRGSTSRLDA